MAERRSDCGLHHALLIIEAQISRDANRLRQICRELLILIDSAEPAAAAAPDTALGWPAAARGTRGARNGAARHGAARHRVPCGAPAEIAISCGAPAAVGR